MAWLEELETRLRESWRPGEEFTLEDVYARCEQELRQLHPDNSHIRDKIRQLLQHLRDSGQLDFVDNSGTYRLQPPGRLTGHSPIPSCSREDLIRAMRKFDSDLRDSPDWTAWEDNNSHKFAILSEDRRYPVKQIIHMATGASRDTFSGGNEANSFVSERGLQVVPIRAASQSSVRDGLETVLARYVAAREREQFGKMHPLWNTFAELERGLRESPSLRTRSSLSVKWSMGQGNWVKVPWIAFLDSRETTTAQVGVYGVFLFRQDMSGVYLTFNQGVTQVRQELGGVAGRDELRARAREIRAQYPELQDGGYKVDDEIDLRADPGLGSQYEDSTIAYKFYERGAVPSDAEILADIDVLLEVYDRYVSSRTEKRPRYWIFQSSPSIFDLRGFLASGLRTGTWLVRQYQKDVRRGDRVFLWESGDESGIIGSAVVTGDPDHIPEEEEEKRFNRNDAKLAGDQLRVRLSIDEPLSTRLSREVLRQDERTRSLLILRQAAGTNFPVTEPEAAAIRELINVSRTIRAPTASTLAPRKELAAVHRAFSDALIQSYITFGAQHDDFVRTFIASLATKRFVILTGLSGSGKTQVALKFGEWLGVDRLLLLPVRPDWTGAEALFGYEDALQRPKAGGRAWHVPHALEFMLQAANDPDRPYMLLLDEMNLAHVERYFADVLSGMESGTRCLPNLARGPDLCWQLIDNGPRRLPVPDNLFVVGTVNVDETTYMFSPKVLDRANTIEFRVSTDDLSLQSKKPQPCTTGPEALVRGFLEVARDAEWQDAHAHARLAEFSAALRKLHAELTGSGFEFAHRVYHEAVRFASMLQSAGDPSVESALDKQVMQKVLPRLHGSRRRLEPTLSVVGRFAYDLLAGATGGQAPVGTFDPLASGLGPAKLPRSFEKVQRMTRILRANQFVSFTE
jgi:hypothetical protein